ncbi:GIY-YIG nuclease family protein, partial [Photobacterium sp. BZF1]|uniref:GIY-YIG nuclease family protein n=1 Tax=Photobacterium sp. BZF1 TaxID=1904457 RepID=UPI001653CA3E
NKGSFGGDILKIGMTRRLEPMDRVRELGDASVPFFFDVHAMIPSDDAPKLEKDLHQLFADRRVNKVNHRREYFYVTIEEVEEALHKLVEGDFEVVKDAQALQFEESMLLTKQIS